MQTLLLTNRKQKSYRIVIIMIKIRPRSSRFYTTEEENILRALSDKYLRLIKDKTANSKIWETKKQIWAQIASIFNQMTNSNRTVESLKSKYVLLRKKQQALELMPVKVEKENKIIVTKPKVLIIKNERIQEAFAPMARENENPMSFFQNTNNMPIQLGNVTITPVEKTQKDQSPAFVPIAPITQKDQSPAFVPIASITQKDPSPIETKPPKVEPNVGYSFEKNSEQSSISTQTTLFARIPKPEKYEESDDYDDYDDSSDGEDDDQEENFENAENFLSVEERIYMLYKAKMERYELKKMRIINKDTRDQVKHSLEIENLKLRQQYLQMSLQLNM